MSYTTDVVGLLNTTSQLVPTNGLINMGASYRNFSKNAYSIDNGSITIRKQGFYHITVTLVGTGTEAGDVTIQLLSNGLAVAGALTTETITTPETEIHTFVIDYLIKVDNTCVMNCSTTAQQTISLLNSGVEGLFSNVVVNISRVKI